MVHSTEGGRQVSRGPADETTAANDHLSLPVISPFYWKTCAAIGSRGFVRPNQMTPNLSEESLHESDRFKETGTL